MSTKLTIAFTGAQSTGKTTIVNALMDNPEINTVYKLIPKHTRGLHKYGIEIGSTVDDIPQAILTTNVFRQFDDVYGGGWIHDRCCLDSYAYALVLFKRGSISHQVLEYTRLTFEESIDKMDILFYIRPEFDLVDDGVRDNCKTYRDECVEQYEAILNEYSDRLKYVLLSGSVEERLETALNTIRHYK